MPIASSIIAATIAAGGAIGGGLLGSKSNPAKAQNQLFQQEAQQGAQDQPQFLANEDALSSFFQKYMQSGSPFLKNIQAASAGQNAKQYSDAAGQVRGQLQQAGMGYGPSGTLGATLGGMSSAEANNASSNYLQNLLTNEQLKFQAANGLSTVAGQLKPGQPASVNGPVTTSGLPGAIQAAGNSFGGVNWGQVFGNNPTTTPTIAPSTQGVAPGTD